MQTFSDERLLREIGEARDAGVPARSHDAALLLAARHHGRIRGLVAAFEFPGQPGVRIPTDEYDDVTQDAWRESSRCSETCGKPMSGHSARR